MVTQTIQCYYKGEGLEFEENIGFGGDTQNKDTIYIFKKINYKKKLNQKFDAKTECIGIQSITYSVLETRHSSPVGYRPSLC